VRILRPFAGWLLAVLSIPAGIGFLYFLRHSGVLAVGPDVHGALPLQQLAGGETQPLGRVLPAWLSAGLVAGLALGRLVRARLLVALVILGLGSTLLLLAAGAGADTVAISDNLGPHLLPQLSRPGTWVAVGLLLLGAAPSLWLARRSPHPHSHSRAEAASAR